MTFRPPARPSQRALRFARSEGLPPEPNEPCMIHQEPESDCMFCNPKPAEKDLKEFGNRAK